MGVYILLSPNYPEYGTYISSLYSLFCLDFMDIKNKHEIIEGYSRDSKILEMLHFGITSIKLIVFMLASAIITNLYGKAKEFEKDHCSPNPDELILE